MGDNRFGQPGVGAGLRLLGSAAASRRELDRFVTGVSPGLVRAAYLVTWSDQAAEDLAQEALVAVAKRWGRVRRMEHPEAYARRIVVNLALRGGDKRRRHLAELDGFDPDGAVVTPGGDGGLGVVEDRSELAGWLGALPLRQRTVLVLRYYLDLPEVEVAAYLGWPVGTVKSTTARALAALAAAAGSADGDGRGASAETTGTAERVKR